MIYVLKCTLIGFRTGDHLAAFPVNRDEDVQFLIKHLTGIPEDPKRSMIQLQEYKDGTGSNFFMGRGVKFEMLK